MAIGTYKGSIDGVDSLISSPLRHLLCSTQQRKTLQVSSNGKYKHLACGFIATHALVSLVAKMQLEVAIVVAVLLNSLAVVNGLPLGIDTAANEVAVRSFGFSNIPTVSK